jgi:hypothetical protein
MTSPLHANNDESLIKPNDLSEELWVELSEKEKKDFIQINDYTFAPKGVAAEIWEKMDTPMKEVVIKAQKRIDAKTKTTVYKSNVMKFFFDFESADLNLNDSVNALSLISALLLATPFSIITLYDGEFFENLDIQLETCANEEMGSLGDARFRLLSSVSSTIYSSLVTLVFSGLYYLFRPNGNQIPTKLQNKKMRFLVFCTFGSTISAVVSAMTMYGNHLAFFSFQPSSDFCDNPANLYFGPGAAITLFSLFLAIYLLW